MAFLVCWFHACCLDFQTLPYFFPCASQIQPAGEDLMPALTFSTAVASAKWVWDNIPPTCILVLNREAPFHIRECLAAPPLPHAVSIACKLTCTAVSPAEPLVPPSLTHLCLEEAAFPCLWQCQKTQGLQISACPVPPSWLLPYVFDTSTLFKWTCVQIKYIYFK
jgi:hypothetical protein